MTRLLQLLCAHSALVSLTRASLKHAVLVSDAIMRVRSADVAHARMQMNVMMCSPWHKGVMCHRLLSL